VTESHHWLKADELFPSNFSVFSIFCLEPFIRPSFAGRSGARAAAIPAPTSLAISSGVVLVAIGVLVGSLVPGWGLPVGRFCMYKSSSSPLGSGEGKGDLDGCPGPGGILPPLPPPPLAIGHSGSGGSSRLDGGSVARLCLRAGNVGTSRIGVRSVGRDGSGRGVAGAVAALVLGGLTGLRHSCRGSGDGRLVLGELGRGIQVANRLILSLARRSSSSTWVIFLWWSAAHNSTLPWKVARCCLRAALASARKVRASFIRVSWVAWHICRRLSSLVHSRIACQTFCASVWYALAAFASLVRTQISAISSLACTRSYTYLVPSGRV